MVLLKLVLLMLTFSKLFVDLDAAPKCPKGHHVDRKTGYCKTCPKGYYHPTANSDHHCSSCSKCFGEYGSVIKDDCTKETDTKCQCRNGFVPLELDSSECKCDAGFELKDGACIRCKEGYVSTDIHSSCLSRTQTTSNSPNHSTTHRPLGGAPTQDIMSIITSTAPQQTTSKKNMHPSPPLLTGNHIGVTLLILGIVGLLLLTAATCKLQVASCIQKKTTVQTKDSLCRRPVEESGESQTPLNKNPEEC
ncbi:tumor necrosis factor receptor superfamily member 3 [Pholidichthys leucotaenia]